MANATITVLEADGSTETDVVVLDVGRQDAAASKSAALSTEDKAALDALAQESGGNLDDIAASLSNIDSAGIEAGVSGTPSADVMSVQGPEAHDAAAAAAPLLRGGKAIAHGTNPTAVAANDASYLYCNRHGIPWGICGHPNIITRSVRTTDSASDASLVGTIGSGTKVALTQLSFKVGSDVTSDLTVAIGFGASAVPTPSASGVNGMVLEGEFAPDGGQQVGNGSAVIAIGGDGEELRMTCDDPGAGNVFVTFSYFTIES